MKTGRRGWLFGMVPSVAEVVVEAVEERLIPPPARPRRRPPGAVAEASFLALCTRCDACVDACPHDAIFTYVKTAGELARTPVMKPERRACPMCEGFPCAAACEPRALVVPRTRTVRLGTVRIVEDRCFTFLGPECGACGGLCPTAKPAIRFIGSQPRVVVEECVGCGLCIEACPTLPAAIEILPLVED
ncbi:MAG: 4Fe-4S dicluster domain-containing protein [Sandaracinaceae bacterium]|nr:4Fe-4S dicluster domain-containing protein [Sandaracinaceae bacterium]